MKHTAGIFSAAAAVWGLLFCHLHTDAQTRKPNIVIIVADDMGYGDIGIHGSKDYPEAEYRLASHGGHSIHLTHNCQGPYCSPTRAGLLTGQYPQSFGHEFNIGIEGEHADVGLPVNEPKMGESAKGRRYRTGFPQLHLFQQANYPLTGV